MNELWIFTYLNEVTILHFFQQNSMYKNYHISVEELDFEWTEHT